MFHHLSRMDKAPGRQMCSGKSTGHIMVANDSDESNSVQPSLPLCETIQRINNTIQGSSNAPFDGPSSHSCTLVDMAQHSMTFFYIVEYVLTVLVYESCNS